jgi:hypothetical protein
MSGVAVAQDLVQGELVLTFAVIWLSEQVMLMIEAQVRFQSLKIKAIEVLKLDLQYFMNCDYFNLRTYKNC